MNRIKKRICRITGAALIFGILLGTFVLAEGEEAHGAEKKKKYFGLNEVYPITDARYLTTDRFLDRAGRILDYAAKHKYVYGNSMADPPCTDRKISCDRLVAATLWSLGFTDQPEGGVVVHWDDPKRDLGSFMKAHGFIESEGIENAKKGSILIVTDMHGGYKGHAFIVADVDGDSINMDGSNIKRYDAGMVWPEKSSGEYPKEPVEGCPYPLDHDVFVYNLPDAEESLYTSVYDYDYYISHYPSVKEITGADPGKVFSFFVNYGMDLGHTACAGFDVRAYKKQRGDLAELYKNDWRSYYLSYMNS